MTAGVYKKYLIDSYHFFVEQIILEWLFIIVYNFGPYFTIKKNEWLLYLQNLWFQFVLVSRSSLPFVVLQNQNSILLIHQQC